MIDVCCSEGRHVFHAWTDPASAAAAAAAFMAESRAGDACVFLGDEPSASRLRDWLGRAAGAGCAPADFAHIRPDRIFTGSGADPIATLIALRDTLVQEAVTADRHVRIISMVDCGAAADEIRVRAEAVESMFTGRGQPPASLYGLCLYDARRYPPDLLELACAAHGRVMRKGRIVDNPLYLNPAAAADARVA